MIKVLIVDDSALVRKSLRRVLETDRELLVVGAARDGQDALLKYQELQPDIVTMDVNMPNMDGLTSLQHLLHADPNAKVLMVSSLTEEGARTTFEALALGALDFVCKPGGTISADFGSVSRDLIAKIKALFSSRRGMRPDRMERARPSRPPRRALTAARKIVVIGVSTGGPKTLLTVVDRLPPNLDAAVLVVQHMPGNFTHSFAKRLDDSSPMPFKEAEAGDILQPGHGYLAPGGSHMVLAPMAGNAGYRLRLTHSPSNSLFMPSVDVTMDSALRHFGAGMVGVILTGMGNDGAQTMERLHQSGGLTIAEHQSTAIVYGMPREVVDRGAADLVLPCHEIGEAIVRAVGCQ